MNKSEFTNTIANMISSKLASINSETSVEIHEVTKNNGITLTGLIIKNPSSNIAPTFYLEGFYDRYCNNLLPLECAVSEIIDMYEHHKKESIEIEWIQDFSSVKNNIIPCLCNTVLNEEFLKSHPSVPFLDLSIYYRIQVSNDVMNLTGEEATIAVTNQLATIWNVSADELFTLAFNNAKSVSPASFKTMAEIMKEMISDTSEIPDDLFESTPMMYVLSNIRKTNGAVWMADKEVLSTIATQFNDDFYLLPSSRNELILIPSSFTSDEQNLKDMIREVNDTQVSIEDMLSYSLYKYNRKVGELQIA